jgi:hypothetical protein
MTRSFKMLVVLAMVNADRVPGEIEMDTLVDGFARLAGRTARLRGDVGVPLDDRRALRGYLERNPIDAWTGGGGTGGTSYFAYEGGRFRTTFDVPAAARRAFQELTWELAEWRLAEYLARAPETPAGESRDTAPPGDRQPAVAPEERGLSLWRSYPREEIPARLGLSVSNRMLQSGVVSAGGHLLLFVTLEKASMPEAHRYLDRFLSANTFQWQSQNRTPQDGSIGRALRTPASQGKRIHLFVRRSAKMGGATSPFVYCGEPVFVNWEGERPITVRWRLPERVPEYLWERLGVPREEP